MYTSTLLFSLLTIFLTPFSTLTAAKPLGLNCRGSGLCPLATLANQSPTNIVQILRDAIYASSKPLNTSYAEGDHIICISQSQKVTLSGSDSGSVEAEGVAGALTGTFGLSINIGIGGICVFPNYLLPNGTLTLGRVRELADQVLEHGCKTCGSATVKDGNDPKEGYLTFNYVEHPFCDGTCISARGTATA